MVLMEVVGPLNGEEMVMMMVRKFSQVGGSDVS